MTSRTDKMCEPVGWRDALEDCHGALVYIRQVHGELYGVGWDRCMDKAARVLAAPIQQSEPKIKTHLQQAQERYESAAPVQQSLDEEGIRLLREAWYRIGDRELRIAIDAYLAKR